ncbi:alpha/beta fold hydrolase [Achromobacter pestifer]
MKLGHRILGNGSRRIIVLHGWFGDHSVWAPTLPYLDPAVFQLAFPDYRGYGLSRNQQGAYTIDEIVGDILDLVDGLRWETFSLIGHSMGGMVAQRIAMVATSRVQSILAITPVPASGVPMPAEVASIFRRAAGDDQAALQILNSSLGHRQAAPVAQYILRHQRETSDTQAFAHYYEAFAASDYSSEAAMMEAPIHVMTGEYDEGVRTEFAHTAFNRLFSRVTFEVIPNAGHYPMLEVPAYLATRINRHFSNG